MSDPTSGLDAECLMLATGLTSRLDQFESWSINISKTKSGWTVTITWKDGLALGQARGEDPDFMAAIRLLNTNLKQALYQYLYSGGMPPLGRA